MILWVALAIEMTTTSIEGWSCRAEPAAMENKAEWKLTESELRRQLRNIKSVVPADRLKKIQEVGIWIHAKNPQNACMAYHPSREWLQAHSLDPEMGRCVEIGNIANFNAWTDHQPWMVMHELAHAYHDQQLKGGFFNSEVEATYNAAVASKKYESVLNHAGQLAKHYGLTNPMEYFAEASEAYFGKNDFQPFINSELRTFDPQGYALMVKVWGEPMKKRKIIEKATGKNAAPRSLMVTNSDR